MQLVHSDYKAFPHHITFGWWMSQNLFQSFQSFGHRLEIAHLHPTA